MNIYAAAVYSNTYMRRQSHYMRLNDREKDLVHNLPHILESYHYVKKGKMYEDMRRDLLETGCSVFMDSGAFSAFTLGVELRVKDYVEYIQRNRDLIRTEDGVLLASVLDGIGNAKETWDNQHHMEYLGVRPLPCFHHGEPPEYLAHYAQHYPYITLGGMVGGSTKQLCQWLDDVWEQHLVDGSGRPRLKVHGFGITSAHIMQRYPWHSVDSSSWIQTAGFGVIMTPDLGNISVSDKSPDRHYEWRHISTLSPLEKERLQQYFLTHGFDSTRLSEVYESRATFNLHTYVRWEQHLRTCAAFVRDQPGLFNA